MTPEEIREAQKQAELLRTAGTTIPPSSSAAMLVETLLEVALQLALLRETMQWSGGRNEGDPR